MHSKLVVDALQMAIDRRQPRGNVLFHSDRGSQYCSTEYRNVLVCNNIYSSMSRKGNCWDNAVSESFFGTLKNEQVSWQKYSNQDIARLDIIDYIEMFYNSHRLHSTLGYMNPIEFENQWYKNNATKCVA